ncbi:MAG: isochorismatase [Myxococcales bacterium]|nr:isochorismatase [Myxococcales bacterium]
MSYRVRPIRYLRQWQHQDWRLKVYGISAAGDRPSDPMIAAGERLAIATLPSGATADGRHGVGLLGIHEGVHACFVFVSWWAKIYELNHFLFRGPKGNPDELAPVQAGLVGCTWDLRVVAFERDAWISSMSGPSDGPNLEQYLAATFNADV